MEILITDISALVLVCLFAFLSFVFFHSIAVLIRESKMSKGWLYPESLYSLLNDDFSGSQRIIGGRRVPGGFVFRDHNLMWVFVPVVDIAGHCDIGDAMRGKLSFCDEGYSVKIGRQNIPSSKILRPEYKRAQRVEEIYNRKG